MLSEEKHHELNIWVNKAMLKLYEKDPDGEFFQLFIIKLIAISKLKGYGIKDENKLYVVTKAEYEKLRGKNMKCTRQVVDDRAFEKKYNIEWYLGNG